MDQYPKSPDQWEVEMLRNGKTWYGMWTCRYWEIREDLEKGPPKPCNDYILKHSKAVISLRLERDKDITIEEIRTWMYKRFPYLKKKETNE